ncbi:RDD family protein [Nonomuraea sp. NPDC050691]|uniref:RDD family protein n=1 Tax=Nonomuraea sp. NPDC050691 TaxID=3155661 RepID=UPI0033EF2170
MSEVVTGDAVVVEVRVAQLPSRALALAIDMVVQVTLLVGALVVVQAFAIVSDPALLAAVMIVFMVLVLVGYPVIFETATRGRSLGKLALGLRVVGDDGGPERFRQALFRGLAGMLEIWAFTGAPALISSLVSQRGKRLGDVFAGTIVIAERAPRDLGHLIVMPPPLAAWAATLELSQLPEGAATAARQYLLRWHDLAPAVRHEMGVRIATQVAAYVSPAAPAGVPPHAYLSAVLAERRRREEIRLARAAGPWGRQAAGPVAQAPPAAAYSGPPAAPPRPMTGPQPPAPPQAFPAPQAFPGPQAVPAPQGFPPPPPFTPEPPSEGPQHTPGGFAPPQ